MIDEATPLRDEIEKHIRVLVNPLKEEDEIAKVLKVKLTKKEFKLLNSWANSKNTQELLKKLNIDEERYSKLSLKLIKKLNQEKLKQSICI